MSLHSTTPLQNTNTAIHSIDVDVQGEWMHALLRRLFPICRSLAGPGNRRTLDIVGQYVELLKRHEIASGTHVFDWVVPDEWIPRSAEIVAPDGSVYARFSDNNLHLASHSEPVNVELELGELLPHIYSLSDQPDVIPYVTRYYKKGWAFCMADRERRSLPPGRYKVHIDADLTPGSMSLAEACLPGKSKKEILISTYICHPSMAYDNLSGVVVAVGLHRLLAALSQRYYSYRFLFLPETIGSIAWLSANREHVKERTEAGLVLSCVGNDAPFTYKASRRGNCTVDRIAVSCMDERGQRMDFTPVTGSDERQFCSPGFDLPVGLVSCSYPGTFAQYHTSADNPEITTARALGQSLQYVYEICLAFEANATRYRRVDPYCEPMLSKRDLYHPVSIRKGAHFDRNKDPRTALMWVLSMANGEKALIDMAERSGLSVLALFEAAELAANAGILERIPNH